MTMDRPAPKGLPSAVLFHPDCDRRLRNYTGSADLPSPEALAGYTAGGEFHPALRTRKLVAQQRPPVNLRRRAPASAEDHRAVSVPHHPALQVQLDRARQHPALDVAADGHEIVRAHGMRHPLGFLLDDRPLV